MPATKSRSGRRNFYVACLGLPLSLMLSGCQGLPTSSTAPPPAPSVTLNQTSVNIGTGATAQFTANVQNLTNTAVSWSVDGIAGGNATVGNISATGLYTAPAQPGIHTASATSVAQTTVSGSASVAVGTIAVSPAAPFVAPSANQQFSATIQGFSDTTVTWSVDGVSGGNPIAGTITSAGLYTAPSQPGKHTITAASVADAALTAGSTVSVFSFTITPASAIVAPSAREQFAASLTGLPDTSVVWSVDGIAGGNARIGTVTSSGLYSAPASVGPHTVGATSVADSSASVSAVITVVNFQNTAVLTYHNDDERDGAYLQETNLTPTNVNSTQFGKLLSYPVDGQVYAQPLYLPQVSIGGLKHDVVYVVTQNNSVYAFDADATAAKPTTFWHLNLGPSVPKGDIEGVNPNVGILSTPVIDSTTNTIYLVVESSLTGVNNSPFYLYALDAASGIEKIPHVSINATDPGSGETLETSCYQRMALALNPVTNWIYIPFGSCTHGWVLAYDKTTLAQKAVFNDTSGAAGGGLWASGGAPAIDDASGNLYLMTGVDSGDEQWISNPPSYTQTGYNDSFLNLNAATLAVQSYFSPDDNRTLAINDADLGSGANILVPGNPKYPKAVVGGGKDGNVYITDPNNMGGFTGSNNVLQTVHIGTQQYNNIFSTPVY